VVLVATCSLSSSILFARDLAFVSKILGSDGLSGRFLSLSSSPALQPRFCLHSLLRLRRLVPGMLSHGAPGLLAISTGMLFLRINSAVTVLSLRNPTSSKSCQL